MPIYKYTCRDCGEPFKRLVKSGSDSEDESKPVCPNCGSSVVEKEVPNIGIRFKGEGFYRTDYGDKGSGGSSSASTSSASPGSDTSDTETEN